MAIVNTITNIFKLGLINGGYNLSGPVTPLITIANGATVTNSVSSMSGITIGMSVSGTGIANGSVIANTSSTSFTLSQPTTAPITASTVSVSANNFYFALITANPTGTYDASTTNYSQLVANGDEVSGSGYTAGGVPMTNQTATLIGNTVVFNFYNNPSWGISTFSYSGAILYDASPAIAGVSGTVAAVYGFGNQSVAGTTLTLNQGALTASTALIRMQ